MNAPSAHKLAETCIYHGAVQKIKELTSCINLVKGFPMPAHILEIGTASGGTFWLWCQLAQANGHIISLDLPLGRFNNQKTYTKKVLQSYGKRDQQLSFIRSSSHSDKTESKLSKLLNTNALDLLFIDGDHTYEGVKEDYLRYVKYVNKGGLIIFHDIVEHNKVMDCNVNLFWNEIKKDKESYEFIDPEPDDRGWGNWGGIGVLIHC